MASLILGLCTLVGSLTLPKSAPTRPVAVSTSATQPLTNAAYTLHDAAAAGDTSAVDLLLLTGYPCEALNAKGSTPLHLAAKSR